MNLNRRNVLAGLGAAAVGTGAAFGSGAFTQIEAERDVEIFVEEDDEAAGSLEANDSVDGVSNTALSVDMDGVNEDSTVWFGAVDDTESPSDVDTHAFEITNNTLDYDVGDDQDDGSDAAAGLTVSAETEATEGEIELYAEPESGGDMEELHNGDDIDLADQDDSAHVAIAVIVDGDEDISDGEISFTISTE